MKKTQTQPIDRKIYDSIIIGGGASGLFCAAQLLKAGKKVLILEPNRFLGRKLRITGKGRCNITNNCSAGEAMKNVLRNPKFLFSSLASFPPEKIMEFFESAGLQLKTERGRRVFPESDSANDVADALVRLCGKADIVHEKAREIITEDGAAKGVRTSGGVYYGKSVVLAAGGKSYPKTGSDGNGYTLAESLGHSIIEPRPSLVPIETKETYPELAGLELKNIALSLFDEKNPHKPVYKELGQLNFEPYGISGPLALTASCYMDTCKGYKLVIDFKPALSLQQLDQRLVRDISEDPSKPSEAIFRGLLPRPLDLIFAKELGIGINEACGNITKEKRKNIAERLKSFTLTPVSLRGFGEAIVTCGGISVKEIDPSSMESKLVKDLYFAGEIIDCDGFTGGYNLTIAFSTAHAASESIIKSKETFKWE